MKRLQQTELDQAVEILKNGGLIAFPTETVYGLGVVYDNKEAYERLVAVKRRPPEKPFSLMLADPEDVKKIAKMNNVSEAIVREFMPGQITMVTVAKEGLPSWCVGQTGYVGIRVPDHPLVRELIRKVGKPLLVPSANKSGEQPGFTADEVEKAFGDELDAILEGKSTSNIPSTVILVEDKYTHLSREGAIKFEDIKRVVERENKKWKLY